MFIPNATIIRNGIVQVCLYVTAQKIYIVPKQGFSGAGSSTTTTTFTIGGKDTREGLQELIANTDSKELETKLTQMITQDWGSPAEDFILSPKECPEFQIKTGLLSKGIYYKRTPQERRNAIAGVSKADLLKIQELYGF